MTLRSVLLVACLFGSSAWAESPVDHTSPTPGLGAPALETTPLEVPPAALPSGTREPLYKLRMNRALSLSLAAGGGAAWLGSELFGKPAIRPVTCQWCDRDPDGTDRLGGFDAFGRKAAWSGTDAQHTAAKISDALGFVVVPLSVAAADTWVAHRNGVLREAPDDLLIIAESAVLAAVVNQTVKFLALRERPFVHALREDQRLGTEDPNDNNLSFYSGHTSFVFALAASAGTVAELRGYEGSWLVWAVGMPLAAATGYLRMAADKHYLTDVLVGAAVGSAFGVGVPLLLHPRNGPLTLPSNVTVKVIPTGNGVGLVGSF